MTKDKLWQWIKHQSKLDSGEKITPELFSEILEEEMIAIRQEIGDNRFLEGRFKLAKTLFKKMIISDNFDEFLTIPAYEYI